MHQKKIIGAAAAACVLALTGAQGGCGGSSGAAGGGGGAPGALQCNFDTFMQAPVKRQIVATSNVTCDFPVVTSVTTLVIQGRKTGSGDDAWDNFDDPKRTGQAPPNELTYTVTCIGGYDYQASADITGVGPNGQPFHSHETTPVVSYSAADCTQN